jgi:hypothetical protein
MIVVVVVGKSNRQRDMFDPELSGTFSWTFQFVLLFAIQAVSKNE